MKYLSLVFIFIFSLSILGCGQSGPLYLPKKDNQSAGSNTQSEPGSIKDRLHNEKI